MGVWWDYEKSSRLIGFRGLGCLFSGRAYGDAVADNNIAIDDKIYVVGGRFGAGFRIEATELLEMYDPKIGSWVSLASMPTPRSGVNGIAVRDCFHVWGGEGEWNNAPPRVFP